MKDSKFYTVKQVASLLGFSTNTVYKYLDSRKIKATRLSREGRFRIPEDEVQKLLQLHGRQQTAVQPQFLQPAGQFPVATAGTIAAPSYATLNLKIPRTAVFETIGVPILISYFSSTLSILVGAGLLLSPFYFSLLQYQPLKNAGLGLGLTFVILGILNILPDLFNHKFSQIRTPTQGFLVLAFLFLATFSLSLGNLANFLTYGAAATILLVNLLAPTISHRLLFLILAAILTLGAGILYPRYTEIIPLPALSVFAQKQPLLFSILWFGITIPLLGLFFLSLEKRRIFGFFSFLAGFISLFVSALLIASGVWDRALFAAVLGTFFLILPVEDKFHAVSKFKRRTILFAFVWLVTVLLSGILLILFNQAKAKRELAQQNQAYLGLGRATVENFVTSGIATTEAATERSDLVSALSQKDTDQLYAVAQNIYASANVFRRIGIMDASGTILVSYPEDDQLVSQNLAGRTYYKKVKETGETFISDVFTSAATGAPQIIIVSSPIYSGGKLIGLLNGNLDLSLLEARLMEITKNPDSSRFVVADREGKYIVGQDEFTGQKVNLNLAILPAIAGESGAQETYSEKGRAVLSVFEPISLLSWGIALQIPLEAALRLTSFISLVVFLATISAGIGLLLVLFYLEKPLFGKSV